MTVSYSQSVNLESFFTPFAFLLMGAGAVYFIKILHQHFDDNDL